jgi:hypothetical protein
MITHHLVDKAIEEIRKRPANYEYFFNKLNSPDWFEPLRLRGFFCEPPEPVVEADTIRFPIWPESRYLLRMAAIPDCQARIVEVALTIPETKNVRVHEDLVAIACLVSSKTAVRFAPKAIMWLESPYKLLLPEKLTALVSHLARGGEANTAIMLARKLFALFPDPRWEEVKRGGEPNSWLEPRAPVDDAEYERLLHACINDLVQASGKEALNMLADLLDKAVEFSAPNGRKSAPEDSSEIWRPSIEGSGSRGADLGNALVSAVRNAAESLARQEPSNLTGIVELLEARPWEIFQRISRWLLGRIFAGLDDAQRETVLLWIDAGPSSAAPEATSAIKKRVWQRDHFNSVAQCLYGDWERRYSELVKDIGEPVPVDDTRERIAVFYGPTSPKAAEDLMAMDTDGLVTYLMEWRPSGVWDGPSVNGLTRALRTAVAGDPERFSRDAAKFKQVSGPYVAALLSAFRENVERKAIISWEEVACLCRWVVQQPQEPEDTEWDSLSAWRGARKAAADLLRHGFQIVEGCVPYNLRTEVWDVIKALCADPNPSPKFEGRYGGSNMDPVTLSVNTVRGEAMHAIIDYAFWVRLHLEMSGEKKLGLSAMPEVREALEEHLSPERDPSSAIRSVYGQSLFRLAVVDLRWIRSQAHHIFPSDPSVRELRDAAWQAYLIWSHPSASGMEQIWTPLLEILKPEYSRAIEEMHSKPMDGLPWEKWEEHLGEHLMVFYAHGKLDLDPRDDFIARFFEKAPGAVRAHALAFVGRSVGSETQAVPPQILSRFQALWESRMKEAQESGEPMESRQELTTFGWWFVSGKFDDAWCLEQLRRTLDLVRTVVPDHLVAERLASLVSSYPLQAIRCLSGLIEGDRHGWGVLGWREHARAALQSALASLNTEAREAATNLIHVLGSRGHGEFRDLLIGQ